MSTLLAGAGSSRKKNQETAQTSGSTLGWSLAIHPPSGLKRLDATAAVAVLRRLRRKAAPLTICTAQGDCECQVMRSANATLKVKLSSELPPGPCEIAFSVSNVPALIQGMLEDCEWSDGADDAFPYVAGLTRFVVNLREQRAASRVPCGDTLRWFELDDGTLNPITSQVINISPTGLCIETLRTPPVGRELVGELRLSGGAIGVVGVVTRRSKQGRGWRAGISLSLSSVRSGDAPDAGEAGAAFAHGYLQKRFPRLVPRARVGARQVAHLFEESGYLALRSGQAPSSTWHRFQHIRSVDLAYQGAAGELIGHISVTQGYRNTWLFHQLATLGGHPETGACRSDIYAVCSCAPAILGGDEAGALAYYNQRLRWHQRFLHEFVAWTDDEDHAALCCWERLEPTGHDGTAGLPPGYSMGPVDRNSQIAGAALVRHGLPKLVAERLDVGPHSLTFDGLPGMKRRSRRALGLFFQDQLRGVALCELSEPGSSLFNLFNMAQVVLCRGATRPSTAAQLAFVQQVRGYYRQQGIETPLLVAAPGSLDNEASSRLNVAESMGCVALSPTGLRRWESYCQIHMSQLYGRNSDLKRTG